MSLHDFINAKKDLLVRVPKKYWVIGVAIFALLFYMAAFRERSINYSYSTEACDRQLVILPELMESSGSNNYVLETSGGVTAAGYPLWATKVCAQPVDAPQPGDAVASISPFGWPVTKLSYRIKTPEPPKVDVSVLDEPIAVNRPLGMALSEPDKTFSYAVVESEGARADCETAGSSLSCDIPTLDLKQGSEYDLSLERRFKDEPAGVIFDTEVETLSPVSIKSSSIKPGATVYNKPRKVTISTDKPMRVAEFSLKQLDDKKKAKPIDVESKIEGKDVVIAWSDDLPRESTFRLEAKVFEAEDGSAPLDTYKLEFKTSGGPKADAINIGTAGVNLNTQIVVTFDQPLKPSQDMAKIIAIDGVSADVSYEGKSIFIKLKDAPRCHDFKITLKKGLLSKHDIASDKDWVRKQRTVCHTVSTVGLSHEGRAITAYEFGNGSRVILFVGAIHGNEYSTFALMNRWIQELESRATDIPSDKKIVVVPQINPDGVARGSRVNANNVDLNRNFDTLDWEKDITTVNDKPFKGGGGKKPMSESESRAMAALATRLRPELTLSYHSIGNLLAANQAGRSSALTETYSRLSGYRNVTGQSSGVFGYSISGTWDDYLAEKLGLASILIELGSHSYHQFERNQSAMWSIVKS